MRNECVSRVLFGKIDKKAKIWQGKVQEMASFATLKKIPCGEKKLKKAP